MTRTVMKRNTRTAIKRTRKVRERRTAKRRAKERRLEISKNREKQRTKSLVNTKSMIMKFSSLSLYFENTKLYATNDENVVVVVE